LKFLFTISYLKEDLKKLKASQENPTKFAQNLKKLKEKIEKIKSRDIEYAP